MEEPSPGILQNISITAIPDECPVISWSSVQYATHYKIYRANSLMGRYFYEHVGTTSNTSWTDNSVLVRPPQTASSTNYYRVASVDSYSEESITSAEVSCGTNYAQKDVAQNNRIEAFEYSLTNNFPNPFNPSTTIYYSIKEQVQVNIKVFDILGREVTQLVNEIKEPGKYSVKFNAAGIASGLYIYTIKAGSFFDSKKMLLNK